MGLQKHSRIVDPIYNLIMLMVALPVLDTPRPAGNQPSRNVSFVTTTGCFNGGVSVQTVRYRKRRGGEFYRNFGCGLRFFVSADCPAAD